MPAVANIVINDALATPVAHTFIPMGPDANGVWWWEDQSAASPIGYNRISMKLKRPPPANNSGQNSRDRVNKVMLKLYTPKLENTTNSTVSGVQPAPTISYVVSVSSEYVLPERCALQDRKDLRKFNEQLQANAIFTALVETLQNVY